MHITAAFPKGNAVFLFVFFVQIYEELKKLLKKT